MLSNRTSLGLLLTIVTILSITLVPSGLNLPIIPSAHAAPTGPILQVWNPERHTSNVTDPSLTSGTFNVMVNITGAGPIGGFDITLNYAISAFSKPPLTTDRTKIFFTPGLFDGTHCQALVAKKEASGGPYYYSVHVAAVIESTDCTDAAILAGTGTLFAVQFDVVGTNATSIDIQQTNLGQKNILVIEAAPNTDKPIPNLQVTNMMFQNVAGTLPVPTFTYSPPIPGVGTNVTLDASQSYFPGQLLQVDRGIKHIIWDFGDASARVRGTMANASIVRHEFLFSATQPAHGFYPVRLVVTGTDSRLPMRTETIIFIDVGKFHSIAVAVSADKTEAKVGEDVGIKVTVANRGNQDNHASLNVTYTFQGTKIISQNPDIALPTSNPTLEFHYVLNTANLTPQSYQITTRADILNANLTDTNSKWSAQDSVTFTLLPLVIDHGVSLNLTTVAIVGVVLIAAVVAAVQLLKRRRKVDDSLPE